MRCALLLLMDLPRPRKRRACGSRRLCVALTRGVAGQAIGLHATMLGVRFLKEVVGEATVVDPFCGMVRNARPSVLSVVLCSGLFLPPYVSAPSSAPLRLSNLASFGVPFLSEASATHTEMPSAVSCLAVCRRRGQYQRQPIFWEWMQSEWIWDRSSARRLAGW